MRDTFRRVQDGENLDIEVDLDVIEHKDELPWLFSVFVKSDRFEDDSQEYEEFLETKESLIIALAYEDMAKYVGSRVVDGWSELYFYASSSKELNSMVSAILSPTNYVYESNVVRDTKWDFYLSQLSPSELEYHHIVSAKIIEELKSEGDELEIQRDVEHYVSFETPTQKNRFVNNLSVDGFSYKDDIAGDEFEHGVALVKKHSVTYEEVKKVIEDLFLHVKKEHGFYEGWSTVLVSIK
jgi:uncharacterized protein (TIGR01619 family)